ncbi:hypothetical protein [Vreelandella sp. TE19]
MKIERKTTAASMAPLQSLAQGSMFWQPDSVEISPWLQHLPWIFWLMETMQPKRCVTLGARPGSPHLAFCQATMRTDPDAECILVSDERSANDIATAAERRYGGCHRLVNTSPTRAARHMQPGIDIIALDLAANDENMDLILERWLGLISAQGVVLLSGINGGEAQHANYELFVSLQERYRTISFHHGEGLGVVIVGEAPAALIETLLARWKTTSAARAVRDIFARLGRGIADQALNDQNVAKLSDVQQRLDEVSQERNASSEQASRLSETLQAREQEFVTLNEELAQVCKTLAEAQSALEASNAEKTALEVWVTEKDASISTRFNELAVLTNMVEEADKKRENAERRAAQLHERNEEKKVEAKEFRRQLAKAQVKDEERKEQISELRDSVDASEAAYGDAAARENKALSKIAKLEELLQSRDKELAARFEELGDLTAAMEKKEAQLEALKQEQLSASKAQEASNASPSSSLKKGTRSQRKRAQRKQQEEVAELEASQWFDGQWYLNQYPDIASETQYGQKPALHYLKFGGFEGRDPSPHFDSAGYLRAYPDIAATGINPLLHYLRSGIKEEREPRPQ